jgi:hypothetical protein
MLRSTSRAGHGARSISSPASHGSPAAVVARDAKTEEDDASAEIRAWFEDYERKLRSEAIQEGRSEGERSFLLRLPRTRFGELPPAAIARIEAADPAEIERWGERMFSAATLAEVLDEPS